MPVPPRITWARGTRRGQLTEQVGTFASPFEELPSGVETAQVTALFPDDMRAICVFLGGHSETTVKLRRMLARPLTRRGIGALLLQTPYYGVRSPDGQDGRALATVADQFFLSAAVVEEAAALVAWIRARYLPAALYGYSMGGALAGHTACRLPWPITVALGATGISGGTIFARDLIARQVCWDALGDDAPDRLEAMYDALGLGQMTPPIAPDRVTLVGCRRDGMVAPASVEALAARWPDARLAWVNAGHLSGAFRAAPRMRKAIAEGVLSSRTRGVSGPGRG